MILLLYIKYIIIFFLGLSLGSFATFFGYRIFNDKLGLFGTRSVCPVCLNVLAVKTLIPVFSYILLRGKCYFCSTKISARYPIVELLTSVFVLYSFITFDTFKFVVLCVLITCCFSQIISDVEYYMASDFIDIIMLICIGILCYIDNRSLKHCILFSIYGACFILFCKYIVMLMIKKDPLGFGDVKIIAIMSPLIESEIGLIFTAFLFGIFGIIFGSFWKRLVKSDMFPFVPPIVISFLINYFFFNGSFL